MNGLEVTIIQDYVNTSFKHFSKSALRGFNNTVEAPILVAVAVILWQVMTEIKNALWQNYLKSVQEECEVVIEWCLSSNVSCSPMKCGRGGKIWKNISPKCSRQRRGERTNEIFLWGIILSKLLTNKNYWKWQKQISEWVGLMCDALGKHIIIRSWSWYRKPQDESDNIPLLSSSLRVSHFSLMVKQKG